MNFYKRQAFHATTFAFFRNKYIKQLMQLVFSSIYFVQFRCLCAESQFSEMKHGYTNVDA